MTRTLANRNAYRAHAQYPSCPPRSTQTYRPLPFANHILFSCSKTSSLAWRRPPACA